MDYVIRDDLPAPLPAERKPIGYLRQTIHDLPVGLSATFTGAKLDTVRVSVSRVKKRAADGRNYTVRQTEDGVTVWRLA